MMVKARHAGNQAIRKRIVVSSMTLNFVASTSDPTARIARGGTLGMDDINPTKSIRVESVKLTPVAISGEVTRFSTSKTRGDRGLMSRNQPDQRSSEISVDVSGPRAEAIEAAAQWIYDD